jgi:hypothetical protein
MPAIVTRDIVSDSRDMAGQTPHTTRNYRLRL